MEHTPGPWVWGTSPEADHYFVYQDKPGATAAVALVNGLGDTHLIAAAPDLLEACEVVLKKLPDGIANSYLSLKTQLQNAIAKAKP
ncbi:hypothetical protein LCGC14_0984890 [marine sediment metagenome]|uniref:Uncharacterized protein n=1 Tax=marine sediment metagenome TaxID=412755 RepID=A0A0F9NC15_9ZZZZ